MKIVVLFNLREGVAESTYEAWANSTDIPTVRGLKSIGGFDVVRTTGVMGSSDAAPYRYVEIIDVDDMETFGDEVGTTAMQRIAGEFQDLADNPLFLTTESIE